MRANLDTPLKYNAAKVEEYYAMSTECGQVPQKVQEYSRYALNLTLADETAVPAVLSAPDCSVSYTISPTDTCLSIATTQNVSTYDLIWLNHLGPGCIRMPSAGGQICLPESCQVHVVKQGENCLDLIEKYRLRSTWNLQRWNPVFNQGCTNIADLVGTAICVSAPGEPVIKKALQKSGPTALDSTERVDSTRGGAVKVETGEHTAKLKEWYAESEALGEKYVQEAVQEWAVDKFFHNCTTVVSSGTTYLRATGTPAGCRYPMVAP